MTPKERATELHGKMTTVTRSWTESKQCALIAIDEIINSSPLSPVTNPVGSIGENKDNAKKYWQKVSEEIQKL